VIAAMTKCPTCGNRCAVLLWRRVPDGKQVHRLDLHDTGTAGRTTCKSYKARVLKQNDGTWRLNSVT